MENTTNNALITMDENEKLIADLTARTTMFSSMKAETPEEQKTLFNAMNNPEKRIADCINMTINAKDVFCEIVPLTNEETGERT